MADKNTSDPPSPLDMLERLLSGDTTGAFSRRITGDEVDYHDGKKIMIPKDMTFGKAKAILERLEKDAETPTAFNHNFLYRADDGAWATLQVIKKRYGMALGMTQFSFFGGMIPAETREIAIGVGQKRQVPWGLLELPVLPGLSITLCDQHADRDYGRIFEIHAEGPKKYQAEMDEFFSDVEEYLKNKSIYRGKAIIGADDPEFLDMSGFDASKIVFSDEAETALQGKVYAPIRYTAAMRKEGISLKRTALLEGPYGTGKTSAGQIIAQLAEQNGWTFISARPGRDKVEDVLRTARLYQPAVVFVEDIDNATSTGEDDAVTKMLDAFDGITAKGGELMVVMTTNHKERIHKGMLRPGRLDAVIPIGTLDRGGIERLIKVLVDGDKLAAEVDYDKVAEAMDAFLPAYVKEAATSAVLFAIDRLDGKTDYVLNTEDLVNAATALRPQLDLQDGAGEGTHRPTLDQAMEDRVTTAVKKVLITDGRGINLHVDDLPKE